MPVDIRQVEKEAESAMKSTLEFLDEAFAHIRAGRANPRILDGVMVEYYGTMTQLSNAASISTPDGRTIIIQPWEKQLLKDIERAIINSEVGIMPDNNGEVIRLTIPPLTEERRKVLVKQAGQEAEDAKISIRNARRDAIDVIKKSVKDGLAEDAAKDAENDMQKLHDKYIKLLEAMFGDKEKEIMTV